MTRFKCLNGIDHRLHRVILGYTKVMSDRESASSWSVHIPSHHRVVTPTGNVRVTYQISSHSVYSVVARQVPLTLFPRNAIVAVTSRGFHLPFCQSFPNRSEEGLYNDDEQTEAEGHLRLTITREYLDGSDAFALPVTKAPTRTEEPKVPVTSTSTLRATGPPTSRGMIPFDMCAKA